MNLFVKLSVVTIFFFPPVAGWAGTQEEAKVVEQPSVKTTEPWKITIGFPAGWPGPPVTSDCTASTHTSASHSDKFSSILTILVRSAAKFKEGVLVS